MTDSNYHNLRPADMLKAALDQSTHRNRAVAPPEKIMKPPSTPS